MANQYAAGSPKEVGLRSLPLLDGYDSSIPDQNIATEFLVPVLERAQSYDRLSGYFNSGMIAAAARGVASFAVRGNKLRVVASPQLSGEDISALSSGLSDSERAKRIQKALSRGLENLDEISDQFERDHVAAFAWMLESNQLEVRIAIPSARAHRAPLFHTKVGFVTDQLGDSLSFSGSINETSAGWTVNVEEFKVFKSWTSEQDMNRCYGDRDRFNRFWNSVGSDDVQIVPLPEALQKQLVKLAPREWSTLRLSKKRYEKQANETANRFNRLRDYQSDAVQAWESGGRRGMIVMATGTGKTKTAAAAIERARNAETRLITIITAPFQHIAQQWAKELADMDPITSWGSSRWRQRVGQAIADIAIGYRKNLVVIMVQQSGALEQTSELWTHAAAAGIKTLLVADEAHGLGAKEMRRNLDPSFDWRLGLTATPDRYFDDEGRTILFDYFGGESYNFSIERALSWIDPKTGNTPLCQYRYYPYFFELQGDELEQYAKLTRMAISQGARADSLGDGNDQVARLFMKRANIVKTAAGKLPKFRQALIEHGPITQALVYCHDKDQLAAATQIINDLGFQPRQFTGAEGTTPEERFGGVSEREWVLNDLATGDVDCLVSMKCLDEGVDVPSARIGFLLASSGNPKEFIQRRGRILRPAPGKAAAVVVDFICVPPIDEFGDGELRDLEKAIFSREIDRMIMIAGSAINSLDVTIELDAVRAKVFRGE
jgi:superfamily II DNA or RNA helicase